MTTQMVDAMPFARTLGIELLEAAAERIVGAMEVRLDLCTAGGILHGGAVMAFADSLGAIGAFLTLPGGAKGTTTVESKTNFLGPAPVGARVIGTATPVKTGRTLSVWQTAINLESGRQVALVTQTQLVL